MKDLEKVAGYILLFLIVLNIPTVILLTYSSKVSALLSFLMIGLALLISILGLTKFPVMLWIWYVVSFVFFTFSLLNFSGSLNSWLIQFVKYTVLLFGSYRSLMIVRLRYLFWLFIIGGIFVFLDAFYLHWHISINEILYGNGRIGRYAGLYINANAASAAMLFALLLINMESGIYKILGFMVCVAAGFLTLSRTFMITFMIFVILSFELTPRKLANILVFCLFVRFLLPFMELIDLRSERLEFIYGLVQEGRIEGFFDSKNSRGDLRTEYSELIVENPIIGNGFNAFRSGKYVDSGLGVHNTFIAILGEGGALSFITILIFFGVLAVRFINRLDFSSVRFKAFILVLTQFWVSHTFFEIPFRILLFSFLIHVVSQKDISVYK